MCSSDLKNQKMVEQKEKKNRMVTLDPAAEVFKKKLSKYKARSYLMGHILKNAAIPIVQGVPASVLFALTGAIITERVYVVPGAGNLLTEAISKYDNGVIVGVTLFYAVLSVISIILGDVLMSMVDPRISFSTKDR